MTKGKYRGAPRNAWLFPTGFDWWPRSVRARRRPLKGKGLTEVIAQRRKVEAIFGRA
jgi:hypothetical protein